jgi:hypothetical protein
MPYIVQTDLEAKVPATLILQALDDNADGVQDDGLWDKVYTAVENEIHGVLEGRYAVPFASPYPSVVVTAAFVLMAEAIYLRRGLAGDQNPWTKQAADIRKTLADIGSGDKPLKYEVTPAQTGGAVISEPAKTYQEGGLLMV